MNYETLSAKVAEKMGATKVDAKKMVDALVEAIEDGLKTDGRVVVKGLGSFTVKTRAAREGYNPLKGERIQIEAKNYVKFSSQIK